MNRSVLALGDVNPDILLPLKNADGTPLRASVSGGGTVANVASGLARLRIPVSFCGRTGEDAYGHLMEGFLREDGVDTTRLLFEKDCFTNMAFAVIDPDGERTIFIWPPEGAAQSRLTVDDLQFDISPYSLLHISTINLREEPSGEAILSMAERFCDSGKPVTFDMNLRMEFFEESPRFQRNLERALDAADIIFGSAEEEIMPLTGIGDPEKASRVLAPSKIVIARMGPEGVLCVRPAGTTHIPAYPVEPVNTIGAGDAFDSGFIAGHILGLDTRDAAIWGNACAAVSITRPDARSCPTRDELYAFLRSNHPEAELKELLNVD